MIRLFASTDDSPMGTTALAYLNAMLRAGRRVRLISLTPGSSDSWMPYYPLLATPMSPSFRNVVCCEPTRWVMDLKIGARNTEVISGRCELHTVGAHNTLITLEPPDDPVLLNSAKKYEQILVPRSCLMESWQRAIERVPLFVDPTDATIWSST